MTYLPKNDISGRPVSSLSARELRRRILGLERQESHPIRNQYLDAYRARLAEIEGAAR